MSFAIQLSGLKAANKLMMMMMMMMMMMNPDKKLSCHREAAR